MESITRPFSHQPVRVMISLLPFAHVVLVISSIACYPTTTTSTSQPTVGIDLAHPTGNSRDQMALLTFKASLTSDPLASLASWNDTTSLCRWRGVICGRRHPERVTGLHLRSFGVSGPIPTSLANLTFLRELDLSNNSFHDHIPPELGQLFRLRVLNLSVNSLAGEIPASLSNCSRLLRISAGDNFLTGHMPPWLENLTSLNSINLQSNSLAGIIPSNVGALISLGFFSIARNKVTGTIPSSFYNLSSLAFLDLGGNHLFGTLPSDMGISLPNLRVLSLYGNQFHGYIPSSIANASALQDIQLDANSFSGVIPSGLGALERLRHLLLYSNQLQARNDDDWSFLTSLSNCTGLEVLMLADNRLEGVLPSAISNLSNGLVQLVISENRISGSIPEGIGSLVELNSLFLGDNLLEGEIPTAIGQLQKLVVLYMQGNKFSGQIPSFISNLTQLTRFIFDANRLQGVIPPSIGNLQRLELLSLSDNKLSGLIPKELVNISSLCMLLNLSRNFLSGPLPAEVGHMSNLNIMDVSENNLSGEIPTTLGDCGSLVLLNIRGNAFKGVIPQSFSKLRGLEGLDLSRNNLSGEIPVFLQNFSSLNYLNLSYNDFEGEVPKGGIFQNASAVSILGNHKLCGGIPELDLQICSPAESRGDRMDKALNGTIITSSIVGFCVVALILYFIFSRYLRRKRSSLVAHSHEPLARVTYSELFKATEGFSSSNLIGVGSFGSVYRANMDPTNPNGQLVAVKVINLQQQGASKSFMRECEALRNIRHRNLLKILTSCSSIDFSGNDFKALIFEFMPEGSLEQWLHHPRGNENGEKHLSLAQRLNIAVDVASALTYLHHHNYEPIVHCDLKPSNILLDNDMTAHVSDFGIARFLCKDDSGNPTSSLTLRGSIGYIAPEYGIGCNASFEGDVFSYGVLLLEMITGRRPTDASFVNDLTLRKFVERVFPERILDIVDPILLSEDDGNAYHVSPNMSGARPEKETCLISMARLGLMCSKESPNERMQMEAVAKEMTSIRDIPIGWSPLKTDDRIVTWAKMLLLSSWFLRVSTISF